MNKGQLANVFDFSNEDSIQLTEQRREEELSLLAESKRQKLANLDNMVQRIKRREKGSLPTTTQAAKDSANLNELDGKLQWGGKEPKTDDRVRISVSIPENSAIIDEFVENLLLFGPTYEARMMEQTKNNRDYTFFSSTSLESGIDNPSHWYYLWRLDTRINEGSSISAGYWDPNRLVFLETGQVLMPPAWPDWEEAEDVEEINPPTEANWLRPTEPHESQLLETPVDNEWKPSMTRIWSNIIRRLTINKLDVANAMSFAINQHQHYEKIVNILVHSFSQLARLGFKQILARLYLISDILYNTNAVITTAWRLRALLEPQLPMVFGQLGHYVGQVVEGRLQKEHVRRQVVGLLDIWRDWSALSLSAYDVIINSFNEAASKTWLKHSSATPPLVESVQDIDGVPLRASLTFYGHQPDESLDGVSINCHAQPNMENLTWPVSKAI